MLSSSAYRMSSAFSALFWLGVLSTVVTVKLNLRELGCGVPFLSGI